MFQVPDHKQLKPGAEAVVCGENYRFTILSTRLIRMEWSPTGSFVDGPTQMVVNRIFPREAPFNIVETEDLLEIRSEHLFLSYDKKPFSPTGLSVSLLHQAQGGHFTTWHFGDELPATTDASGNLGGTARTLDNIEGACPLEPGIVARYGFAVVDDSTSVELGVDDWIAPRSQAGHDLYFFGHGIDYQAALSDFFRLTGPVPLIPRRVLGNWWSRFWRYSDTEYLELMDRFADDGIPFSVAVLDMDWHLVGIDPSLGSGWTGYTWNRELFPEPEKFLAELHERGKLVTLNLHPADGVRAHEDAYAAMATALGIDPASEVAIPFDITSPSFVEAYLQHLHHPLEDQGVDFWWLDWQSGGISRIAGLDPLWMLNHIHFHDSGRDGRRPLTFSRYSGLGSHRYPIGFSGDTVTTWASLEFQPFFTATAANVGYTWWSHDIGGHFGGVKDNQLTTRWVQFGAFSPINRLHSSMDPFNSKDPAQFPAPYRDIMIRFLRLRHLLVPYLYTAAWRAHADGAAVVRPMYHDYPEQHSAYNVPNQYLLGDDLIVAPITTPSERESGLAAVTVWLPEGTWTDLFTGQRYDGGRRLVMHRPIEQIPVLVREGASIPMLTDPTQDIGENPEALVLRVTLGNGESAVFEDDGAAACSVSDRVELKIRTQWCPDQRDEFVVRLTSSDDQEREFFVDLAGVDSVRSVELDGLAQEVASEIVRVDEHLAPALRFRFGHLNTSGGVDIVFKGVDQASSSRSESVFALLDRAEIEFALKHAVHGGAGSTGGLHLAQFLETLVLPPMLCGALIEVSAV